MARSRTVHVDRGSVTVEDSNRRQNLRRVDSSRSPLVPAVLCLGVLALLVPTTVGAQTPIWLEWAEVTSSNINADASVGANDLEEKDFATADVDLDGDIDLISVRKLPFTTFGNRRNVLYINIDGVLTDLTATLAPGMMTPDNARDVQFGEFNGDIWPDFVVANAGNQSSNGQQPRIFINLGEDVGGNWLGYAEEPARLPFLVSPMGSEPNACAVGVGDLTQNGVDDLYLVDYQNDMEDRLLINDGTGFFTDQTAILPAGFVDSAFATAGLIRDMNGDGWPEILKNTTPSLRIAYNDGSGGFSVSQSPSVAAMYHFDVGDLDGDTLNDIFAVQDPQDQFLINASAVGATPVTWQNTPLGTSPLTTGFGGNVYIEDLDGDGDNDVTVTDVDTDVGGCGRRMAFLRNDGGTPTSISDPYPSGQWTPAHHTGVYDVAIADFNGDGALDIFVGHCNGNDLYFQDSNVPDVIAPTGFSCPQVGLDVELSWFNGESYDAIEVRRDGAAIATLGGGATSYTDVTPSSGPHSYSLVASVAPDESSPVACGVQVTTVESVLGLTCDQVDEDVALAWTNQAPIGGGSYTAIEVYRSGTFVTSLPGTATQYLDLAPPLGLQGYAVVALAGAEESEPTLCTLSVLPTNLTDLVIGFTADDNGSTDSVAALMLALEQNGIFALEQEVDSVGELATAGILLDGFERVWLELGMFPNNKLLSTTEAQTLADYVNGGGQLYVSGGDFFCFNATTVLHALTGIDTIACSDGTSAVGDVLGIVTSSCDLLNFSSTPLTYAGEASFVDHLEPLTTGIEVLRATSSSYVCGVLNTLPGGGSVISQSVEMGGIGVDHDKKDLVERYISCFGSTGGPAAPVAQFTGAPTSGNAPIEVFFTDLSSGTVDTWFWEFGDGGMSGVPNPSHTYTAAGAYTVSLTVTNTSGSDTETKVAYIDVGEAAPVASFTADPTDGEAPLTVQFTDTSVGVVTGRTWLFGDGDFGIGATPEHTYDDPGKYTVSLTVTGPGGNDTATEVDLIVVVEPPGPGFVRGDVNQDGGVDIGDAVATLGYSFGGTIPGNCLSALDTNDDSGIDISDAVSVLAYLFSAGGEPPAPFPSCGEDPTPDGIACDAPPCP